MVRADGHSFSKFTKGLVKPFDSRLSAVMVATMLDTVAKFNALTGYTHSDEITLVFGPADVEAGQTLAYNGKVSKIVSLVAAYISVRFNAHMLAYDWSDLSETTRVGILACEAHFDARAFSVPHAAEAWANLLWRSNHDCRRNSVSMLARVYYSAKQLHGISTRDVLAMLEDEHGVAWEAQPRFFTRGTVAKKELYDMAAIDRKTGEAVVAKRSRFVARAFPLSDDSSAAMADLVLAKYWPDDFDPQRATVVDAASIAASGFVPA